LERAKDLIDLECSQSIAENTPVRLLCLLAVIRKFATAKSDMAVDFTQRFIELI